MSALKKKGRDALPKRKAQRPKAGPKKRRAKTEEEKIREAVDQNTRAPKAVKKAGRVRKYQYKEPPKEQKGTLQRLAEAERAKMRTPRPPSEFERFEAELPEELRGNARHWFQVDCPHDAKHEEVVLYTNSVSNGQEIRLVRCNRCHLVRRWWGTRTETNMAEWMTLKVPGVEPRAWGELYTKDTALWRYIIEEIEEDANA